ncbi:hypothetical protein [Bartonella queenslandensis]|uniref:hypothetical protein n=1 Tax=Bartonella queenslandensis TaxID=481138 RepID=UPI0002DB15FA|nr:hypothetical protein [Bartonella queenslandensis]
MKRVVLAAALFAVFSSVLSPVTVSALPAGGGWGTKRDAIVAKIMERNGLSRNGERGKEIAKILGMIVVPERRNLFSYSENSFQIAKKDRSFLLSLGIRSACRDLDPKKYSGYRWMSCSIN